MTTPRTVILPYTAWKYMPCPESPLTEACRKDFYQKACTKSMESPLWWSNPIGKLDTVALLVFIAVLSVTRLGAIQFPSVPKRFLPSYPPQYLNS
jgi:hypothetical protein